MATYLSNRDGGGYTNENGHFRLPLKMLEGEVFSGFEVKQTATASLQVQVTAGELKIPYQDYSYAAWSDATINLSITTPSSTSNRIDTVVAYIDRTMTFTTSDTNNPGALKLKVVSGSSSSGTPVAPADSVIASSVGSGNPWIKLANVTVGAGTTQITNTNIDNSIKKPISLSSNIALPAIQSADGNDMAFAVIRKGENFPSAIPGKTLIVFVSE